VTADTPASADAAKPSRADRARPAEPDRGQRAEQAPERQHSDAGRSQQPAHALNRADHNAARHAEHPIRGQADGKNRGPADASAPGGASGGDRRAEHAPPRQAHDADTRSPQGTETFNRADHNAARHAESPIRSPEHRPEAGHETRHERGGGTVRTPESPARQPADGSAARGNPDVTTRTVEGNSRTSEHNPDVRPVLTHFHSEFKGHSTDLYTDGTRWAPGDQPRGHDVTADRGEIPERLPTGEDLVDTAGEESSRIEKLRRELYDETGDLSDDIEAGANRLHDIFSPPPTSSYEATPLAGPHFSTTQHAGMDVGAGAAALFALGLTIDRVAIWAARHLEKHPERD
jgi:hypothetical protein